MNVNFLFRCLPKNNFFPFQTQCSHTTFGLFIGALLTALANQTQVSRLSIHLAQLFPFPSPVLTHRNRSTHWRVFDRPQANQTRVSSVSIHLAQLFPFPSAVLAHRNRSTHWRVIDRAQANQTQVSSVSIHLAQLFPFPTTSGRTPQSVHSLARY